MLNLCHLADEERRRSRSTAILDSECNPRGLQKIIDDLIQRPMWLACVIAIEKDKLAWWKREMSEQTEMVRRMHQAGVAILAGTDSLDTHNVPGFALAKELELLVHAGFTPMEALLSATIRPAEFLGLSDAGNIVVGNAADLLLLDADPTAGIENIKKIQSVFVKGRYFSRSDLDHMLDAIRVRNCGAGCSATLVPAARCQLARNRDSAH